jgi:hypothetical protein
MATADGDRSHPCESTAYETSHDADGEAALSETIIFAVATADGVDPIESDLQLYDAVDLEALDALFERRSPDDHWRFEFSVEDYLVVVEGNGDVTVCDR